MIEQRAFDSDTSDLSLARFLWGRAARTPGQPALTFGPKTYSYGQLKDESGRLATVFANKGVKPGDRVAFIGKNSDWFLISFFAASAIGATLVPVNFRLAAPEVEFIVADCAASVIIADQDCSLRLQESRTNFDCEGLFCIGEIIEGWDSISAAVRLSEPIPHRYRSTPDEVALTMYTSGTTGRPKGAKLTHGNLFWNNLNILLSGNTLVRGVSLTCGPLFHVGGLNVTTSLSLMLGAHVVLHEEFDPAKILQDIPKFEVRTMWGAPAMFAAIAEHTDFAKADLGSVDLFVCGGAPVPKPLIETYRNRGIPLCQGYGLTETSSFAAFLPDFLLSEKLGGAGLAPMFGGLTIRTENGEQAEKGERGEVCVSGPMVFSGYLNRPEETAASFDVEWFRTGDVGYLDEDGVLFLCDRIKDVVISGGENVYPAEVEEVLLTHPSIAEVAVIGLPHPKWGEAVTAVLVPRPGEIVTLEQLREFAAPRLARFKLPLRVEIVAELPRTPAGKVLKFKLREQFA